MEVTINTVVEKKHMILETIKNLLGEELTTQVETALKGKGKDGKDIDIVVGNDGSYVPAAKYNEEKSLRATAEQAVKDRDKQIEDLSISTHTSLAGRDTERRT